MTPARAGHDVVTLESRDTRLTLSTQGAAILALETAGMPILRAARGPTPRLRRSFQWYPGATASPQVG
jgi:hypothetical protein